MVDLYYPDFQVQRYALFLIPPNKLVKNSRYNSNYYYSIFFVSQRLSVSVLKMILPETKNNSIYIIYIYIYNIYSIYTVFFENGFWELRH